MNQPVHDWSIPEHEYARHEARRGRRFAYEALVATRTALVVIDMEPAFVEGNRYGRGAAGRIDVLARCVRDTGGIVAWVVGASEGPSAHAVEFFGGEVAASFFATTTGRSIRDRLWSGLEVHDTDLLAEKTMHSAFFPGASDLVDRLRARNVDTVLVAGAVTSVCCESSARDASALDFRVVMVADAMAGVDDASHNATLRTCYRTFGDVRPVADLVPLLDPR